MSSRWTKKVTAGARIQYQVCQSCGRQTPFLFDGYAKLVFRLDPIRCLRANLFLGNVVRFVQAKVCQRCREENVLPERPKPLLSYPPDSPYLWEKL